MVHLFKVPLQFADMFVRAINLKKGTMEYQILEKDTGIPLEPVKKDKILIHNGTVLFDKNRPLNLDLAKHIELTLNS